MRRSTSRTMSPSMRGVTCRRPGRRCLGLWFWAVIVVCGCSGEADVEPTRPESPELQEVARLGNGDSALASLPADCRTTHAILIVGGGPQPRRLRSSSRACLIWGNTSSARVRVTYTQATNDQASTEFVLPARSAYGIGPYVTLKPRAYRQLLAEGGQVGCTTLTSDSHYGARYRAATGGAVTIAYRIDPGGAMGEIVIGPPPGRGAMLPAEVRAVQRLRCGRRAVDGRPAQCRTPQALRIVDGRPTPSVLRINKRPDCVVWGNEGSRPLRIESDGCPPLLLQPVPTAPERRGHLFRRSHARAPPPDSLHDRAGGPWAVSGRASTGGQRNDRPSRRVAVIGTL